MNSKYKLKHDISKCIGCQACTMVAPAYWEMGEDGVSHAKGAVKMSEALEEKEIEEKDVEANIQAARSCPVTVIRIFDMKTGQELK